jgi:hypothetical protein
MLISPLLLIYISVLVLKSNYALFLRELENFNESYEHEED